MQRDGDIVRYTAEEIDAMVARGEDLTDWARIDAMTEEELEASIAADPDDVHEELDWSQAINGLPPFMESIDVPVDADVLSWFRQTGEAYQMRMNDALRAFVESRKRTST